MMRNENDLINELNKSTLMRYVSKTLKIDDNSEDSINERTLTEPEMEKREDIVKGMKKNLSGFKDRYGKKARDVMYATATKLAKEEVNLDEDVIEEMSGAGMSASAVHKHLKKAGWELSRTSGGHDVFTHPKSTKNIAVPRHKGDLKVPTVLSILKSSRISEGVEKVKNESFDSINEISDCEVHKKMGYKPHKATKPKPEEIEVTIPGVGRMRRDQAQKYYPKEYAKLSEAWRGRGNETHDGEFQEKEHGNWYTYKKTNNAWAKKHNLPHEIDVGPNNEKRFGHVKGTVAHIASDENADGTPKISKWNLKKHNKWVNEDFNLSESRKAEIVKDAWKSAKAKKSKDIDNQTDVGSKDDPRKDTFQKDPEMDTGTIKQ